MLRFFNRENPESPPWWKDYKEINERRIKPDTPLHSITFSVIDIESTGTDPSRDRMISFAAVSISDLKIHVGKSLELIINHFDKIGDKAVPIHEITQQDKQKGIPPEAAIPEILRFLGNSVIVGFNISFDRKFIDSAIKKLTGGVLLNVSLEINELVSRIEHPAHRIHPAKQRNLFQLCQAYGIEAADMHTAAGDAFSSAQLFLTILNRLQKRGIISWKDLKKNNRFL